MNANRRRLESRCWYAARLFTLIALTTLLGVVPAKAQWFYRVTVDEVNYSYSDTLLTASVYGYVGTNTEVNIPNSIVVGTNSYAVTEINNAAFYGCSVLERITLPAGVSSIGQITFSGCSNLLEIVIPDGVTNIAGSAFNECTRLTNVVLPENLETIATWAFRCCESLETITIPEKVSLIEVDAFSQATRLKTIEVAEANTNYSSVDGVLFNRDQTVLLLCPEGRQGSYTVPETVTEIGPWAFSHCVGLAQITISDSVTTIGKVAFGNCTQLEEVKLPSELTEISVGLFFKCSGLKRVVVPDTVTTAGMGAFSGCTGLENVVLESGITEISNYLFKGCSSLKTVTIRGPVTLIKVSAFAGCTSLEQAPIPASVTRIETWAFQGCSGLKDVVIPNGVVSIEGSAFVKCPNLRRVSIPASVEELSGFAFACCNTLEAIEVDAENPNYCSEGGVLFNKEKSVLMTYPPMKMDRRYTIPTGVTELAGEAFFLQRSLMEVTVPASVTKLGYYAFDMCPNLSWIIFEGNPPEIPTESQKDSIFYASPKVQVYYVSGATGWVSPWYEQTVQVWDETVPNVAGCVERRADGGHNMVMIYNGQLEWSDDLIQWQSVSDAADGEYIADVSENPRRYYRGVK